MEKMCAEMAFVKAYMIHMAAFFLLRHPSACSVGFHSQLAASLFQPPEVWTL